MSLTDPQPGDRLKRKTQSVTVLSRSGDQVTFTAKERGKPARTVTQSLTGWLKWAPGFQEVSECIVHPVGAWLTCVHGGHEGNHQLGLEFYCVDHCPCKTHGYRKERKKQDAAGDL